MESFPPGLGVSVVGHSFFESSRANHKMVVCLLPHRFDPGSHAIFNFFSFVQLPGWVFWLCGDKWRSQEVAQCCGLRTRESISSRVEKENAAITLWDETVFPCIAHWRLGRTFQLLPLHQLVFRTGKIWGISSFQAFKLWPIFPLFCDVLWQESEGGLSPSISAYSLASSHEEAPSVFDGMSTSVSMYRRLGDGCIKWKVKAMALLERTRRSFLERNPSAGADGCRAQSFFSCCVFFCSDGMMEGWILDNFDLRPEMAWANDETARWTFFVDAFNTMFDSLWQCCHGPILAFNEHMFFLHHSFPFEWAIGQAHLGCMRRQPAQSW